MAETLTKKRSQDRLRCMEIWGGNEAVDNAVTVAGIDAWIYSRPYAGHRVGGDIHYVSTCGHGHIARFALADVSGHGAAVGDLGTRLRALMRANINQLDQTRFIRALNKGFSKFTTDGRYATAVLTTYFAPTDHLVVCNAGHPPPLLYRARSRSWRPLRHDMPDRVEHVHNLPLGVIDPTAYYQFAIQLEKNDLVLMYTDWLPESRDRDGRPLGDAGLLKLLERVDPTEPAPFCGRLVHAVAEFTGHAPPQDDVTVMLLRHNASDPPSRSPREVLRVLGKALHLIRI